MVLDHQASSSSSEAVVYHAIATFHLHAVWLRRELHCHRNAPILLGFVYICNMYGVTSLLCIVVD